MKGRQAEHLLQQLNGRAGRLLPADHHPRQLPRQAGGSLVTVCGPAPYARFDVHLCT